MSEESIERSVKDAPRYRFLLEEIDRVSSDVEERGVMAEEETLP